jgi:predicted NBD/HSP70 family sugar kinase
MVETTIGADLGGTKLLLVCGDAQARIETGPRFSPEALEAALRAFIGERGLRPQQIGIAVPGLIGADGRVVACDVTPLMAGWSARDALADLHCRIAVVNDVKAALAEEMHDAPEGTTAGVVMAGTSIGAAFMADGKPLMGASGWAGELGYVPVFVDGRARPLNDIAGGASIAAACGVGARELAGLAQAGDAQVLAAIAAAGGAMGAGLAVVINLLNPSRLAVGGGALDLPGYWDAALGAALEHSLPDLWRACTLTRVRSGARVVALGAARCASSR